MGGSTFCSRVGAGCTHSSSFRGAALVPLPTHAALTAWVPTMHSCSFLKCRTSGRAIMKDLEDSSETFRSYLLIPPSLPI